MDLNQTSWGLTHFVTYSIAANNFNTIIVKCVYHGWFVSMIRYLVKHEFPGHMSGFCVCDWLKISNAILFPFSSDVQFWRENIPSFISRLQNTDESDGLGNRTVHN